MSLNIGIVQAQNRTIHIKKTSEHIVIDGILDETVWSTCEIATNFICNFPNDTMVSASKTEAKVTYNEKSIFISFKCFDDIKGNYIVQSLKRDYSYPISDAVGVIIDPFDDKTNGFAFGVNPYGAQREGLVAVGGGQGVSTDWDNLWFSATKKYDGYWIAEMEIPFKTIRFKEGATEWGINFTRNDLKRNQSSCWSRVGQAYNIATLAFTGKLLWDESPKKVVGVPVSIIPYTNVGLSQNFLKPNENPFKLNNRLSNPNLSHTFGGDAKIAITPSLNLDVTINPDFSQVEVDRQVTNISRFSIFFPERRYFFIENSDLFSNFGFTQIRPFYSRRIGIDNGNLIPILGGFRLSGKPNKNWRIGAMTMQTEGVRDLNFKSSNYSVVAIQRQLFKRSNISAIVVNKLNYNQLNVEQNTGNTIVGADFNLASADNKWIGKAFYHYNISPFYTSNNFANATWLTYKTRKLGINWNHEFVGKNYRPEVGFVPRIQQFNPTTNKFEYNSYYRLEPSANYYWYPKNRKINHFGPRVYMDHYLNEKLNVTDLLLQAGFDLFNNSSAGFFFDYRNYYTRLIYNTDVTQTGKTPLNRGEYKYQNFNFKYITDTRKILNGSIEANYGSYFSGSKASVYLIANYRVQPYAIFSLNLTYDNIILPHLAAATKLILVSPKAEFAFSKALFFTTFFQYNTQQNNFNINSRLQWRFRPMSDVYLVYTDNYNTLAPTYAPNSYMYFGAKNKAIVIKLVWWLNV